MQTISHDPSNDLLPCSECPFIIKRFLFGPLCGKTTYRNFVTGNPYQPCVEVRSLTGGKTINGHYQQCLGYDANKHATVSRKVGL
jgi:hypothetical protein